MKDPSIAVLLIEDSPTDVLVVMAALETVANVKFDVVQVDRLGAAIARAKASPVDVLLLDLGLPDAQGMDAFVRAHAALPDVPILVLSGLSDEEIAVQCMQQGAQDYLLKGSTMCDALPRAIRYAIERHRSQRQIEHYTCDLREAQQRYFRHFDLAPVGMIRLNHLGMIMEGNILGGEMLGIEHARLCQGKTPFAPFLSGDSQGTFSAHLKSALASRVMESCEVKLRKSSGAETLVDLQSVASAGSGDTMDMLVTLTDLTEREKAEAAHLGLERQLFEACRLKNIGTIAGGIAHDLNNILHVILANLDLAANAPASDPVLPLIEDAYQATRRAARLASRLLTFSKGGSPVKQSVEVAEILASTVVLALSGSQLKVTFCIQPDLPPIHVDPVQFAQVIENLVINAREATAGAGGLAVRADAVHLSASNSAGLPAGNCVRIAFEDHGAGIPEDVREKIFDLCFTTKAAGSGIGLATAKSVMEQHGGTIEVTSQSGSGSTFTLLVPAAEGGVAASPAARARIKMGSGRILLVDDEEGIRMIVPRMLRELGYECVTVVEGAEGCNAYVQAKAKGQPFAAVVLDGTIPGGLGGEEALRLILQADPDARVILCSGYADGDLMKNAMDLGFKARLPKPFDIQELAEVVSDVLV